MATRNINNIYDLMLFITRKERGIFITIPEAMSTLDAAQLEKLEEDFKEYGINQTLRDSIRPFKVTNIQFTSANDGAVTYPSDYLHFLDDVFTVYGSTVNKVSFVSEDEKAERLTAQLRPVALSSPIAENTATGFQLYPQQQQIGFYSYIKRPAIPVLAYTQSGRTITYDAANSTQLEWSDSYIDNIIARALAYWGIEMDEDKIIQFTQLKQQQTQA